MQVVWSARLGTRPEQAAAAEGLHTDDRTVDIAVDVDVAGAHPRSDPAGGAVDPRVDAKGETVAGRVDRIDEGLEPVGAVSQHMHDRAEHLALEPAHGVDLH